MADFSQKQWRPENNRMTFKIPKVKETVNI